MSAISVRAPGLQATTTVLDTRSLRFHGRATLESVRRNLFGCVDREENRRLVERELARQLELDCQRWEFDFANEKPLPGAQKFAWQLVPASTIPAVLRSSPVTIATPKQNATKSSQDTKVPSPEKKKAQKRLTEFLKPCKRFGAAGKNSPGHLTHECVHGTHIRPPKVARLTRGHYKRSS